MESGIYPVAEKNCHLAADGTAIYSSGNVPTWYQRKLHREKSERLLCCVTAVIEFILNLSGFRGDKLVVLRLLQVAKSNSCRAQTF